MLPLINVIFMLFSFHPTLQIPTILDIYQQKISSEANFKNGTLSEQDMDGEDIDTADIQPVDLSMAVIKQVTAGWLVNMAEHVEAHPEIILQNAQSPYQRV